MLFCAVVLVVLACMGYTAVIGTEYFRRGLRTWMIVIFSLAFCLDLAGTGIMCRLATGRFDFSFHGCCGYAALAIMFLHLVFAWLTYFMGERWAEYFHRGSIFAWLIWVVTFLSGVPHY